MIRMLLKAITRAFGRRNSYDVSYLLEMCDHDPAATAKLMLANPFLGHRGGLPVNVWHTAHIIGAHAADCGPCLELAIRLAEHDHMPPTLIDEVLTGHISDPDVALVAAYAKAVAANTPDVADHVPEIRKRFGQKGLTALAIAILAGEFYPLLKRGLGHATGCSLYVQRRLAA